MNLNTIADNTVVHSDGERRAFHTNNSTVTWKLTILKICFVFYLNVFFAVNNWEFPSIFTYQYSSLYVIKQIHPGIISKFLIFHD